MKANFFNPTRWLSAWTLLVLGCAGLSMANAAQILFMVNSVIDPATAANPNDQEVYDRLNAQGHTVTLADDQDPTLGDLLAGKDLILISSSTGSSQSRSSALLGGSPPAIRSSPLAKTRRSRSSRSTRTGAASRCRSNRPASKARR